jgi:WD40 repeat protein
MLRIFELTAEGRAASAPAAPALGARIGARSGAAPAPSAGALPKLRLVQRCCCSGHTATVTHIDWSADGTLLMSNCAAHEILVWGAGDGKRLAQPGRALALAHWHDWTCYLGFPVQGIWPAGSNPTDVNAVHMTADRSLLLCAGDAGGLQLFNAPCVVEGAPYVVGTGHCTAITGCRFLLGDRTAVSTGGGDRSVMLWRLVRSGGGEQGGGARGARGYVAALPDMPHRACMLNNPPTG